MEKADIVLRPIYGTIVFQPLLLGVFYQNELLDHDWTLYDLLYHRFIPIYAIYESHVRKYLDEVK